MTRAMNPGKMRFHDAHNHLQDVRLRPQVDDILRTAKGVGVVTMVVNGTCEADWPTVAELARRFPECVRPSYGLHPWCVSERSPDWEEVLRRALDADSRACVGEIGLDRWKPGLAWDDQEAVFARQLRMAAERDLPVSIHCLKAWGPLMDLLQAGPRPARGFLLHSYGGSLEMAKRFAELGAYFSFPGYFAREGMEKKRTVFQELPRDRILIETDAPDQCLPGDQTPYPLSDEQGQPLNHPANLSAVYAYAATLLHEDLASLAVRVEASFLQFFH